jgi:hypothetical protein
MKNEFSYLVKICYAFQKLFFLLPDREDRNGWQKPERRYQNQRHFVAYHVDLLFLKRQDALNQKNRNEVERQDDRKDSNNDHH